MSTVSKGEYWLLLLTGQRDIVAAFGGELILRPEELLAVLDGGTGEAHVATDAGPNKGRLGKPAVLLSEIRALQRWVAGSRRKLLELELVDALGGGEGEEDEGCEPGEQHDG